MSDIYHFHKECKYYEFCTEELIREGKHDYVIFVCPELKNRLKYYPPDVHTKKISCAKFEPLQETINWSREESEEE